MSTADGGGLTQFGTVIGKKMASRSIFEQGSVAKLVNEISCWAVKTPDFGESFAI